MKNDFSFESLKGAKEDTKKSKEILTKSAEKYNKNYDDEIRRGTQKRQLMLEAAGLENAPLVEQEEFFKNNNEFMPTVHTPILNFLYFLTRDYKKVIDDVSQLREEYDAKYGHLEHDYEAGKGEQKSVPHMEDYIYGNMNSNTFQKLKKLKAKSKSDNEHEAFQAYKMCMAICKENGLDFDKIPNLYD
jgi:hypothetical protein